MSYVKAIALSTVLSGVAFLASPTDIPGGGQPTADRFFGVRCQADFNHCDDLPYALDESHQFQNTMQSVAERSWSCGIKGDNVTSTR
jgi:hypothetical protein